MAARQQSTVNTVLIVGGCVLAAYVLWQLFGPAAGNVSAAAPAPTPLPQPTGAGSSLGPVSVTAQYLPTDSSGNVDVSSVLEQTPGASVFTPAYGS